MLTGIPLAHMLARTRDSGRPVWPRGMVMALVTVLLAVAWAPRSGWSAEQASASEVAVGRPASEAIRELQPTRSEVERREAERSGATEPDAAGHSARGLSGDPTSRFIGACMTRLHLDEPLGAERAHNAFCACRIDALARSRNPEIAANLDARNALAPARPRLPAVIDRANQAAIQQCLNELSR